MNEAVWARLAIGGIAVCLVLDIALVFLRPHLSVLNSAESDYGSKGRYAWVMDLKFLLRFTLSLAVVRALTTLVSARCDTLRAGLALPVAWAVCGSRCVNRAARPRSPPAAYPRRSLREALLGIELPWFLVVAAWIASGHARQPDVGWRAAILSKAHPPGDGGIVRRREGRRGQGDQA